MLFHSVGPLQTYAADYLPVRALVTPPNKAPRVAASAPASAGAVFMLKDGSLRTLGMSATRYSIFRRSLAQEAVDTTRVEACSDAAYVGGWVYEI